VYDYAVVRVVPHVEREEFINAGIILFCRPARYLAARVDLDCERLLALAPDCDLAMLKEQLALIPRLCDGEGPIGELGQAETYHWLVAPHSTVIQCSPVHSGVTDDLQGTLERLMETMVRRQGRRGHEDPQVDDSSRKSTSQVS
jgi:hypothetical protein